MPKKGRGPGFTKKKGQQNKRQDSIDEDDGRDGNSGGEIVAMPGPSTSSVALPEATAGPSGTSVALPEATAGPSGLNVVLSQEAVAGPSGISRRERKRSWRDSIGNDMDVSSSEEDILGGTIGVVPQVFGDGVNVAELLCPPAPAIVPEFNSSAEDDDSNLIPVDLIQRAINILEDPEPAVDQNFDYLFEDGFFLSEEELRMLEGNLNEEVGNADFEEPLLQVRNREVPIACRPIEEGANVRHDCGRLGALTCITCGALYFSGEAPQRRNRNDSFNACCSLGKFRLEPLPDLPQVLIELISGIHPESENFMRAVREYNSSLSFISTGGDIDLIPGRQYGSVFKIHGQIYHRISAVVPPADRAPAFGQLYILDSDMATDYRAQFHNNLNRPLLNELHELLVSINPYAASYRMLHEVETAERARAVEEGREPCSIYMVLRPARDPAGRRIGAPINRGEIAVVYSTEDGQPPAQRELAVYMRDRPGMGLRRVNRIDCNLDPMAYPLIFPHGTPGWSPRMPFNLQPGPRSISMLEFYKYRLAVRENLGPILSMGTLSQQFICDAWVKVEGCRLEWIRENQPTLRTELYQGLMDYVENRAARENVPVGRMVILPSSFTAGPRYMHQLFNDAMCLARVLGCPDLFLTFTCNPDWAEIKNNLLPGQKVSDRPDLIVRVFNVKLSEFIKDLTNRNIFGEVVYYVYTIEFQKKLPHAHFLIALREEYKPRTPEKIDSITCAEIPDIDTNPTLHAKVKKYMVHNRCDTNPNAPCISNGRCSKGFPKNFKEVSEAQGRGFDVLRRRDNGRTFRKPGGDIFNNQWVVAYNGYLIVRFDCHINVEIVTSFLHLIKYIFKYIFKGTDAARVTVGIGRGVGDNYVWDEIALHEVSRYISSTEAMWRLKECKMHGRSHTVIRLQVHLENQHNVAFRAGQEEAALVRGRNTMLTAWFELNREDPEARRYLYCEIPSFYTYSDGQWRLRRRQLNVIGRIYAVSPVDVERFHLRILLLHVRGASSFADLRTVNGVVYGSYVEAARARNIIGDEGEWIRVLDEAVHHQMPRQLRLMFASMLLYCEIPDPLSLWQRFQNQLSEDYHRRLIDWDLAHRFALRAIGYILMRNNRDLGTFNLPQPGDLPQHIADIEPDFDVAEERAVAERNLPLLNPDQRMAFDRVVDAIYNRPCDVARCFMVEGPAGTGKTFIYNTLLSFVRGRGDNAVATAYTGIAATLLKRGTTMNSAFGFPLEITDESTSSVRPDSERGLALREAKLIILDEVTMMHKLQLRVLDLLLKDIMNLPRVPFGGKVVLLGGDFRQTLPVLPGKSAETIVSSTIKYSPLFPFLERLHLRINMRANADEVRFSEFLLRIGDGIERANIDIVPAVRGEKLVEVPAECISVDLIDEVFGENITAERVGEYARSAILCPTNNDTARINDVVLNRLGGEERVYYSADNLFDPENPEQDVFANNFPIEVLNAMNLQGLPPHELKLKEGCLVMLLRNIDVTRGLVNGTRLKVNRLGDNCLQAEVISGAAQGELVFLCRFNLIAKSVDGTLCMRRRQFPIKLSYAMTINKSQGQTLDKVGIRLQSPVFSHGQLYVALSRAKSLRNLKIDVSDSERQGRLIEGSDRVFTPNIVWPEVLL